MKTTKADHFIGQRYYYAPGQHVLLQDFLRDFYAWVATDERVQDPKKLWPKSRIKRDILSEYPVGRGPRNRMIVGNLSDGDGNHWYDVGNGRLRLSRRKKAG